MSRYALLCVTVCLATAALGLIAGTILAQASWTLLSRTRLRRRVLRHASFLFFIRTLPLSIPALLVGCAVLPSFLRFEPRQTKETPELWLTLAAVFSLMLVMSFIARLVNTLLATRRAQRVWQHSGRRIELSAAIPIYELEFPDSLIAVVGIFSPRMFIGKRILDCLSRDELQAAIAHEIAHVRSFDNLKQAFLSAIKVPWLTPFDRALRSAAEICADARAMQCRVSPLDLGGAIVKAARLKTIAPSIAASHLVPELESSALRSRLEYLDAAFEHAHGQPGTRKYGWVLALALLTIYFAQLPMWLIQAHRLTEVLVR